MKKIKFENNVFFIVKNIRCRDCAKRIIAKILKVKENRICDQMSTVTGCAVEMFYFYKKRRF